MNKIQFKYIPLGGAFRDGINEWTKMYTSSFDGDSEWYSDYQQIPFKDVKIGEVLWWIHPDVTMQQKYRKLNDAKISNALLLSVSGSDNYDEYGKYGLFYPNDLCIVLRPEEASQMTPNWIDKNNLCKLKELGVGDECMVQGSNSYRVFTVLELHPDTHHLHNDSGLYLLRDVCGRKYFSTATQQVYRKPLPPPKLMLSDLKAGTHFEFKNGWKEQEFVKMSSLSNEARLYYRDFKNVIYWRPFSDDQEVVETIPF